MSCKLEIVEDRLDAVGESVRKKLTEVVLPKVAYDIEADTKAGIRNYDLIDSGFMLNSVQARPVTPWTWEVIVGAFYAIYHEFGTVALPAKPFLGPAVHNNRDSFIAAVSVAIGQGLRENEVKVRYRKSA